MYGSPLASLVNAAVISIFNIYWRKIALLLTTWENYRLEKDFRDQLVMRMFGFQFINCYFSLFYVAFFKRCANPNPNPNPNPDPTPNRDPDPNPDPDPDPDPNPNPNPNPN